MKPGPLPAGAWEKLLPRALALIDEITRYGGVADPFWTFGGGTVLMFRYRHRLSKDIDIFVPDPQYLGFVTPRLSDTAADLTQDYTEQPGAFVKLQFEDGEVDFVASPNLLADAWETWDIGGRTVRVETAVEIIAKKMYHRGDRATARDLFDLAPDLDGDDTAARARASTAPGGDAVPVASPRGVPVPDPAAASRVALRVRRHRCTGLHAGLRPLRNCGRPIPGQPVAIKRTRKRS